MTKKTLILAIAAAFSFATAAQAQVPPSVLQNQNRIQQEQQRLLNEEFRRQELQKALQRPTREETPKPAEEEEPDLVTSCVTSGKSCLPETPKSAIGQSSGSPSNTKALVCLCPKLTRC